MVVLHNGADGGFWEELYINTPNKTVMSQSMYYHSTYNYVWILQPWN